MDHFNKLSSSQQQRLIQKASESQIRENSNIVISLTKTCFDQCVDKYPSKIVDKEETKCVENCAQRFIKCAERIALKTQLHLSQEANKRQLEHTKK